MTATITPVSQHDGATLTRAVAGERVMMDGGAAPIATLLQAFADRCEFAKDAVAFTRPSWAESLYVSSGGTNASFTVGIGAISGVVTYRSGTTTYTTYSYAGGTIGASKIQGGGNLANSTWYYVYAYDNAGSLDFEISTTAPNANLCTKNGDSTRTYLGCFRTLSTGAPIPMRMKRGRYIYNCSGSAVADTRALNAGTATVNTAVDLAAWVPPHTQVATVRVSVVSTTGAAINYGYIRTEGEGGADEIDIPVPSINVMSTSVVLDVITDADQDIAYRVSNNTSAPSLTVYVYGFYE
jgi:hypothetical protein